MRRSKMVKNSSAGIIDSDVNASTMAVSTEYCELNCCTPSGRVNCEMSLRMNSGSRYAFQLATNARMPVVSTPGSDSGIIMRKKNDSRLQPSTIAASSISAGMARRNGTRMMIVVGSANAICGMMTPASELSRPMPLISRYSGVMAAVTGNISPAANSA